MSNQNPNKAHNSRIITREELIDYIKEKYDSEENIQYYEPKIIRNDILGNKRERKDVPLNKKDNFVDLYKDDIFDKMKNTRHYLNYIENWQTEVKNVYTKQNLENQDIDLKLKDINLDYYEDEKDYYNKVLKKNYYNIPYEQLYRENKAKMKSEYKLYQNQTLLNESKVSKYLFYGVSRRTFKNSLTALDVYKTDFIIHHLDKNINLDIDPNNDMFFQEFFEAEEKDIQNYYYELADKLNIQINDALNNKIKNSRNCTLYCKIQAQNIRKKAAEEKEQNSIQIKKEKDIEIKKEKNDSDSEYIKIKKEKDEDDNIIDEEKKDKMDESNNENENSDEEQMEKKNRKNRRKKKINSEEKEIKKKTDCTKTILGYKELNDDVKDELRFETIENNIYNERALMLRKLFSMGKKRTNTMNSCAQTKFDYDIKKEHNNQIQQNDIDILWEKIGPYWKNEYRKIAKRYYLSYSFMNSFMEIIRRQPIQENQKDNVKKREPLRAYIMKKRNKEIHDYQLYLLQSSSKEKIEKEGFNKFLTVASLFIKGLTDEEVERYKEEFERLKDAAFPDRKRKEKKGDNNDGSRRRRRK